MSSDVFYPPISVKSSDLQLPFPWSSIDLSSMAAFSYFLPHTSPTILRSLHDSRYFDHDGLRAVTPALKDFAGAVIIISHNREFTDSICNQWWVMEAGKIRMERGEGVEEPDEDEDELEGTPRTADRTKGKNPASAKAQRRKAVKEIEKKLKEHKKGKRILTDEEYWELKDRLEELTKEE